MEEPCQAVFGGVNFSLSGLMEYCFVMSFVLWLGLFILSGLFLFFCWPCLSMSKRAKEHKAYVKA